MLYRLVRPLAALGIRANYQHICISNKDRIPKDKPVILAANHPTAFMEPCILACFLDRPLFFLVRGDFFQKPIFNFLLRQLNMLPVFRMRDGGYKNLKQNYSTFDACYQALKQSKTIMILAEGRTIHEKRLRSIQKGTARIALGTLKRFPDLEDVYIVPVGVNYTYAERSRTRVMIDFGEPLRATSYLKGEAKYDAEGITKLTEDLSTALKQRVVIIEDPLDEPLTEDLLRLQRPLYALPTFPVISDSEKPLLGEKSMADRVNETASTEKSVWKEKLSTFFQELVDHRISEKDLLGPQFSRTSAFLYLVLGFVPFVIGYLWNLLPLGLASYIADNKVKDVTFYTPIKWAVGIGAFLIWTILGIIILSALSMYWAIPLLFLFMLFGYHATYYLEIAKRFVQAGIWQRLSAELQFELKAKANSLLLGKW